MIKWRVSWGDIERVEFERETEKSIWIVSNDYMGRRRVQRRNKASDRSHYFATWEEAHAHLLEKTQGDIERVRMRLQQMNGRLGQIKGMKKPEDA